MDNLWLGDVDLEAAGQGEGAEPLPCRHRHPRPPYLGVEEAVIERRVVRDQRPTVEKFEQIFRDVFETGRPRQTLWREIVDMDRSRVAARVEQSHQFTLHRTVFTQRQRRDAEHSVRGRTQTGGLDVQDDPAVPRRQSHRPGHGRGGR